MYISLVQLEVWEMDRPEYRYCQDHHLVLLPMVQHGPDMSGLGEFRHRNNRSCMATVNHIRIFIDFWKTDRPTMPSRVLPKPARPSRHSGYYRNHKKTMLTEIAHCPPMVNN
jgi:hypothetical protein